MVLNRPEDEPWAMTGLAGKALAGLAMLYLTFRLGQTVWSVKPDADKLAAPPAVTVTLGKHLQGKGVDAQLVQDSEQYNWGSTGAVGKSLFHDYLFPFEAISILLLAAVVGAIAVARPWKDEDSPDDLNEDVPSEVVS
jgi:NADH-quinone oxidoreductase subunit J